MSAAASAAGCCCAAVDVDEEGSWAALEDGSAVKNDGSNSRVFSSVRGTLSSSRFYKFFVCERTQSAACRDWELSKSACVLVLPWDHPPRASHWQAGAGV